MKDGRVSPGLQSESSAEDDYLQYLWDPLGVASIHPWLQFTNFKAQNHHSKKKRKEIYNVNC